MANYFSQMGLLQVIFLLPHFQIALGWLILEYDVITIKVLYCTTQSVQFHVSRLCSITSRDQDGYPGWFVGQDVDRRSSSVISWRSHTMFQASKCFCESLCAPPHSWECKLQISNGGRESNWVRQVFTISSVNRSVSRSFVIELLDAPVGRSPLRGQWKGCGFLSLTVCSVKILKQLWTCMDLFGTIPQPCVHLHCLPQPSWVMLQLIRNVLDHERLINFTQI